MGPNEVHIYDPAFYHELCRLGSKYYKDPSMHKVLGAPSSTLAESDPVRHKQRRAPLEPLFAKKNILKTEAVGLNLKLKIHFIFRSTTRALEKGCNHDKLCYEVRIQGRDFCMLR